jgi:hypothetical protein
MKRCSYCGYSNYDNATQCRKCDGPFVSRPTTTLSAKYYWVGPEKAHTFRNKALAVVTLGLLLKVYWGGYGPWPVIDYPPWAQMRTWLEPLLIYGGVAGYLFGWVLKFI